MGVEKLGGDLLKKKEEPTRRVRRGEGGPRVTRPQWAGKGPPPPHQRDTPLGQRVFKAKGQIQTTPKAEVSVPRFPLGEHPSSGSMCPPQALAEVGPTMTEKAEMVCASSPAPVPPTKPASPGPLPSDEVGHRGGSPSRLPPGVPVISLGHTRPPGAAMPTTELSALRPPLLHLSTLGTTPPTLALHYHPHPFLNSVYIGPAGPFSIFPSSRLKRRPSHCELDLAEAASAGGSRTLTAPSQSSGNCCRLTRPTGS
ncbi:protein lyl-1 isoform X2 [Marmota marmota marmota]|uniref:protein lyl-1 isoform X2 n=1 Tax=Marmota marmota marmota TaxID=9994 RepID=UPI002091FB50|nr:protein lyl-1 isoform X2 [Marmota marmota marmota]